ncbi:MAG: DUF1553 domain-containing protein [Planctomycetota bacterium]|nr:DUF1553 domain-containing protein [Planctomycetota bacterium]
MITLLPSLVFSRIARKKSRLAIVVFLLASLFRINFTYAVDVTPKAYSLPLHPVVIPPGDGHPLDRLLAPYFVKHTVILPPALDDMRFARRTSLDVLGIPPTPGQLDAFLADRHPDRRARWIDRLLADQENFAAHWMTFWSDHLRIGSEVNIGTFDGNNTDAPKAWLKARLDENMPLDRFAREMISGEFFDQFALSVAPKGDFLSEVERAEMQMAVMVSQVFLGIQMKCASCHDSFIDRWKLQDAWGLAVALGNEPVEMQRCQTPTGEVAQPSFPLKELGDIDAQADVAQRRLRVAELLTTQDNGLFPRTLVNRVWARLFGRGIIEPLDEMMEHAPWNADLLDWLAEQLVTHQYDLKQLLRLIMTSEVYQLPGVARAESLKSEGYVFSGPEVRWLSAEQFIDSLRVLSQPIAANASPLRLPERSWQQSGSRLMTMLGRPTRDVVVSTRVQEPTPLLALELINGSEFEELAKRGAEAQVEIAERPDAIAEHIYRVLLSRSPTAEEQAVAAMALRSPATLESVTDFIWATAMLPEYQLMP